MRPIRLRYGKQEFPVRFDDSRFAVLDAPGESIPLTDVELGKRFDSPIASPPIEDLISPGESVLLVVPDATRNSAAGQIVNLLVRRLIANGTMPHEMAAIFATGIHRRVTEEEKKEIVTPFIAQRIKLIDHDANNPIKIFNVGTTSGGIPVELNWMLTEYDHVVLVGSVAFHYFAGFSGGRKLICPGLASAKTIAATHALAFDPELPGRRAGVAPGVLEGNPVHEAFVEAATKVNITYAFNSIVGENGEAVGLYCGDWLESHAAACSAYAAANTVTIDEKRELVVVSCGGSPYDINMIQAHKALNAASAACSDGGTIVLFAECPDGLGRDDFLDWFSSANSGELARRLCENYKVNGQTAWNLLHITERFRVRMVTSLAEDAARTMRIELIDADSAFHQIETHAGTGFLIPHGARINILA